MSIAAAQVTGVSMTTASAGPTASMWIESVPVCYSRDIYTEHGVVVLMKKVLVILLLFIFSAQGAVVASGGGFAIAGDWLGMEKSLSTMSSVNADPDDASNDLDDLQVSSSIEEMSDYVPPDMALKQPREPVLSPPAIALLPSSIDLPRALPPPRG